MPAREGTADLNRYLPIYLNDHLAGAAVGVELARRIRASNRQEEALREPLDRICEEIEEDRATLEQVIERLGFSRSTVKPAGAWLAEKLGRLKLNGHWRSYSPLSRLLELEGLGMGIAGKMEVWKTLAEIDGGELAGFDFEALAARAAAQRSVVADLHLLAVSAIAGDKLD